jgi:steroid delta-isomerase-like uncharacterized protein
MSTEQNKALARRVFEEVWNKGNLAAVDELTAANLVFHNAAQMLYAPEGFKQFVTMYRNAFPDTHFTVEDEIAEGDTVVIRWSVRGTHKGELLGVPPTGKQVTVSGITITLFANGKSVETWAEFDALGMLQQLGVIPSMG